MLNKHQQITPETVAMTARKTVNIGPHSPNNRPAAAANVCSLNNFF
jgi:hypothetical protein